MTLTVVIVNWNGGELISRCLSSLRDACKNFRFSVIVVDNDSADGSRQAAQRDFPEFTIFNSGSNLGFGRANNLVKSRVTTRYVLFLNPDTEVLGSALETMVGFMESHPEIGGLGCKMRYPDGSVHEQGLQYFPSPATEWLKLMFLSSFTQKTFSRFLPYLDPHKSGFASKLYGGCLMLRKDALDSVGWFDERYFMYAEDVDLCKAIASLGWKLYYLSEAEVMHVAGGTSKKATSGFSVLMQCESIAKLMHKYYGRMGRAAYVASVLSSSLVRLIFVESCRGTAWVLRRQSNYSEVLLKYRLMLLWALGLKTAQISK